MKKVFLTDCDDVLFDWTSAYIDFMEKHYPAYTIDRTKYSLGLNPEEHKRFVDVFNQSPEFGKLKPFADSVEYVKKISDLGFRFVAITTCMGTNYTRIMRQQNIEEVFGKGTFKTVHCLPLYSSKLETLKEYKPTFWVDDKLSHATDGMLAGHKSFEMLQKHSPAGERPAAISSVKSWQEIYNQLLASINN
jgi:hypothetical protein